MYIKFNEISIKNFQAIKSIKLGLDNQGIVLVKGINEFESNANSNGSGKSSLFESLIWCIFGKTSNGVTDVKNRYMPDGCYVELNFNIDTENYRIIRSVKDKEYGTGLRLYCNENDITRKNKTDTEKQIKEIFNFDIDVFLSTIYLSQGFNSRIGILTPSGRKERIELLTGIADKVAEFKDEISNVKSKLSNHLDGVTNQISYKNGEKNNMLSTIEEYSDCIVEDIEDIDLDKLNELKQELSKLDELNQSITSNLVSNQSDVRFAERQLTDCKNSIQENEEKLNEIHKSICPLCKSQLNDEKTNELKENAENTIKSCSALQEQLIDRLNELKENTKLFEIKQSKITDEMYNYNSQIFKLEKLHENYLNNLSKIRNKEMVESLKTKVFDLSSEILKLENEQSDVNRQYDIANHCVSLVSKSFRTYLLDNIILYMNEKLVQYSKMLFSSGDLINLKSESNKLNIYLGDALYETCSGGEKRKIDIALTVVQRDMLLEIVGVSSNMIILDEVIDFCDETATDTILSMLLNVSDTVSTMAIISHNNYNIPYDKIIKVIKGIDRCAEVEVE